MSSAVRSPRADNPRDLFIVFHLHSYRISMSVSGIGSEIWKNEPEEPATLKQ